ncbi:MAG: hypothetical protein DRI44_08760 [Chlamydiae bacterium]|nr:MAG: hypothetical protein DRI44_08760 [Chlamydiota bacterium]
MKKISTLLLLSTALFLSTFFVGCKPQEEPIALEDILTNFSNNVVEKKSPVEKPVEIKQQQIPENQFEGEITDIVENPTNVILKGMAFLSNGLPVTNEFIICSIPKKKSKAKSFDCKVIPESDGSFTISNLTTGSAKIQLSLPGYNFLITNILFTLPETKLEVIFHENPMARISGIVLREQDGKPAEGVIVKAYTYIGVEYKPYNYCTTDKNGKFSLALHEWHGSLDDIIIDDPGFGKVVKRISYGTTFVKIILRQSGKVIGKVMTRDKKPVPGINISLNFINFTGNSNSKLKCENDSTSYMTVSDANGNYKFSNVIAQAKYGFEIDDMGSGFSLPDGYYGEKITINVEPNKTKVCNLIVSKNTVIAIKVKDYCGYPVLKYELKCGMEYKDNVHTTLGCGIDLSADGWYYVKTMRGGSGILSCRVSENENGLNLITNNIPFSGTGTNYIILTFPHFEPNITGYIFEPDGFPAKKGSVGISFKNNYVSATADEKGYFEVQGLNVKNGELINLNAYSKSGESNFKTNLPSGSRNVVLNLLQANKLIGNVFLNNLNTPAKRFEINIDDCRYGVKRTVDGSFSLIMHKTKGTITISVDGYSSERFEYDFLNDNVCDAGNIILKAKEEK